MASTSRGQSNLRTVFIFVSCEEKGCYRIVSLRHLIFDCRSYCGLSRRVQGKAACYCHPIIWSMAAMLRDSVAVVVAVVVVRTRPRAIPLAMITMRKSTHGFLFFPISIGLRLVALRAAGAPLKIIYRFRPA